MGVATDHQGMVAEEAAEVPQQAHPEEAEPEEAVPSPNPTGGPVTLTTHLQARVDCTGNSGKLLGRVPTDIIVLGEIMNPQDQDTTEIYLLQK